MIITFLFTKSLVHVCTNLEPLLKYPMFEEVRDKELFKQFGLDGTLFWVNGADIAPEHLLENGHDWPPTMAVELIPNRQVVDRV